MAFRVQAREVADHPVVLLRCALHLDRDCVTRFLRNDDVHALLVAECEVRCQADAMEARQDVELSCEIGVAAAASSRGGYSTLTSSAHATTSRCRSEESQFPFWWRRSRPAVSICLPALRQAGRRAQSPETRLQKRRRTWALTKVELKHRDDRARRQGGEDLSYLYLSDVAFR